MQATPAGRRMLVMGRIAGAFGVQGWVHVHPFTGEPGALLEFPRWWVGSADRRREMEVMDGRVHGAGLVAQLAGIADRDQAQGLRGSEIAVPRDWLPAPAEGEVYWADLLGLAVENGAGEALGRIEQVFSNGSHEVLEVVAGVGAERRVRLIPYVAAYVLEADVAGGRVRVDWSAQW